jgi:hypothetical protein
MTTKEYVIPLRYRKMENMHIIFWLFKDISWCMLWKPLGIAMIFPTLIFALVITFRTRHQVSELCHNMAVVFWIIANSYWMIGEFVGFEMLPLIGEYTYKHLAVIPFTLGILILAYYYAWWKPRNKSVEETL